MRESENSSTFIWWFGSYRHIFGGSNRNNPTKMSTLIEQRNEIVMRASEAANNMVMADRRSHEMSIADGPDYEQMCYDLEDELMAFDQAHPEVITAIRAERSKNVAQYLANGN